MSFANPTQYQMTAYAESWIIYQDQTRAIRNAFPDSKATAKSLTQKASTFHTLVNVQATIADLHQSINDARKGEAIYTAQDALNELEEARELAKIPNASGQAQTAAMVAASMGKSKISGLLVDKVEAKVESTSDLAELAALRGQR